MPILAKEPKGGITAIIIAALPWIVILGLWFFLLRQLQAGGSRAFAFGKSKAKLLAGDTPKITFADVAGADEAKVELQEIIEFLKDPQKFTRLGGRLPKGALLVGPPGTGKTLLAKAVAGEAGRPFFSMSGSDFVEMFVGVGASRVRDLFEQGKTPRALHHLHRRDRRRRPAPRRRPRRRSRRAGADAEPAAGRDGRLRVQRRRHPHRRHQPARRARSGAAPARAASTGRSWWTRPTCAAARGSSGSTPGRSRSAPTCGSRSIAKGTPGMAGADLANLVNEAAVLAARRNKTLVDMQDFEDAKDKVMLGVERRSLVLTEDGAEAHRLSRGGPRHRGASRFRAAIRSTRSPSCRAAARWASPPRCPRSTGTTTPRTGSSAAWPCSSAGGWPRRSSSAPTRSRPARGTTSSAPPALARRMVTQFGMSELIGPLAVGDKEQEIFLGREFAQRREISRAHGPDGGRRGEAADRRGLRPRHGRSSRRTASCSTGSPTALLERETIDREDLDRLVKNLPLPPAQPAAGRLAGAAGQRSARSPASSPARAPILGAPPAEPAGA